MPTNGMVYTTRSLELFFQAVAAVDSFEELARLRATAWELYVGDDETFQDLMRAIEVRTGALSARLAHGDLFPAPPGEDTSEYDLGSDVAVIEHRRPDPGPSAPSVCVPLAQRENG